MKGNQLALPSLRQRAFIRLHFYLGYTMKLTVICPTYNHEKYIEKALIGFVEQITDFKFEVWVVDDASTDSTPEIITKYAQLYPSIIKPILREQNLGGRLSVNNAYLSVTSKYVLFCEGDDYLCCNTFLQDGVTFLDTHDDCIMFSANSLIHDLMRDTYRLVCSDTPSQWHSADEGKITYTHTSTRIFRYMPHILRGDMASFVHTATLGRSYFKNEIVSVYNRTGDGMWSSLSRTDAHKQNMALFYALNKKFNYRYDHFIGKYIKYKKIWKILRMILPPKLFWEIYFSLCRYSKDVELECRNEIA